MTEQSSERLRIDVLTLFPEVFGAVLESSILGIASSKGVVTYHLHNMRDYSEDKHSKVDDRPYGGGPGMVLSCQPVFDACEAVRKMDGRAARLIMLTPQGRPFDQSMARELAGAERLMLLCGHYEGFDERIRIGLPVEEVSIGDYVLSGGEIAAMVLVDAIVRLVPGVLGDQESAVAESFSEATLDHPQYTRTPEFRAMRVPEVLLSGNHAEIQRWRKSQAAERTRRRRIDLVSESQAE